MKLKREGHLPYPKRPTTDNDAHPRATASPMCISGASHAPHPDWTVAGIYVQQRGSHGVRQCMILGDEFPKFVTRPPSLLSRLFRLSIAIPIRTLLARPACSPLCCPHALSTFMQRQMRDSAALDAHFCSASCTLLQRQRPQRLNHLTSVAGKGLAQYTDRSALLT